LGEPAPEGPHLPLSDPISVVDLAHLLRRKPFQIIADLMEFGLFMTVQESIGFTVASQIAQKYGFIPKRIG
jgi:hypothetical protein